MFDVHKICNNLKICLEKTARHIEIISIYFTRYDIISYFNFFYYLFISIYN